MKNPEYSRGVIVDAEGYFLGAVQWQKGTPRPDVNGPRKEGSTAPRLRLLTSAEAIAEPIPGGRWDAKAKKWDRPNTPIWIVNTRRDLPRYAALSGSRNVWPDRLPALQPWQRIVTIAPPKCGHGRKPLFDFDAGEWVVPVPAVVFAEDGETCENIIVKPRLEPGDVQPFEVENEIGEKQPIGPGMKRSGGHAPRYRKVPVKYIAQALRNARRWDAFVDFLGEKGYTASDFEAVRVASLNSKLLREFVKAQGFTMRQAVTAIQRAAEGYLDDELASREALAEDET